MLVLMKELLGITDTSKNNILNFYITKAENAIKNYLNYTDEEWTTDKVKFENQIVDLAIFYYKNKDKVGIIQQSQSERSLTIQKGIPQEIKDSLPLPQVRVVG